MTGLAASPGPGFRSRGCRANVTLMGLLFGLALVLLVAAPSQAQTYSRCLQPDGRVYLSEGAPPAGIRCVAQVTAELRETPPPAEKIGTPTAGQHALWITEQSGVILVRTYPTEAACRVEREARVSAATQRQPLDVAYRCLPAGAKP